MSTRAYQTTPYAPSPTTSWMSYCSDTLKEIFRELPPAPVARDIMAVCGTVCAGARCGSGKSYCSFQRTLNGEPHSGRWKTIATVTACICEEGRQQSIPWTVGGKRDGGLFSIRKASPTNRVLLGPRMKAAHSRRSKRGARLAVAVE